MPDLDPRAADLIRRLDLRPHPEGGHYRETYRGPLLPGSEPPRACSTAILYLLVEGSRSKFHRLKNDEVFHFHQGDPVRWVLLSKDGKREVLLGMDLAAGQAPQMVVPAGTWFGGALAKGGSYALMGTTVAPGFDFADLEIADRDRLLAGYPDSKDDILALT